MRQLIEDMILLVRLESHELGDKDEQTDVYDGGRRLCRPAARRGGWAR